MITPISRRQILSTSRALIVDDSATNRALLKDICMREGLTIVKEAFNGEEGYAVAMEWKPDVILLDVNMPLKNGIEVCEALRQSNNDAVIIIHTAFKESEFKAKAFDAGVTDFISQPFDGREVVARMLAHLERRRYKQKVETDFQRLSDELKEAAMLQTILTPDFQLLQSMREQNVLDVAYYYHPSTELGGDYVGVMPIDLYKTVLIMLDIAGHGVTAALYTFVIHTLLQDASLQDTPPGQVLNSLNTKLHSLLLNGKFATIFLAVIDTQKNTLSFSSAASPAPIVYAGKQFSLLDSSGVPLGVQPVSNYVTQEVPFTKGDVLCLYSDAFTETPARNKQFLSERQLIEMLPSPQNSDANALLKGLLSGFFIECGNNPPDDLTLLICKY